MQERLISLVCAVWSIVIAYCARSMVVLFFSLLVVMLGMLVASIFGQEMCGSDQPLCSQQTAYYSVVRNATIFPIHDHPCIDHTTPETKCVVCGQLFSTKASKCVSSAQRSAVLQFGGRLEQRLQRLDVVSYLTDERSLDPSDYRNLSIFAKEYYIVDVGHDSNLGTMEITGPHYGQVTANDLHIALKHHLLGSTATGADRGHSPTLHTVADKPQGLQFSFTTLGLFDGTYPADLTFLSSKDIEPASWFYSIVPQAPTNTGGTAQGYPTYGYLEFVLRPDQIVSQRRYVSHRPGSSDSGPHSVSALAAKLSATKAANKPASRGFFTSLFGTPQPVAPAGKANICIWSSDNMDGQKRIWLDQTEHLDASKFQFTWIMSLTEGRTLADRQAEAPHGGSSATLLSSVLAILARRGNGRVVDSPYNGMLLDAQALAMDPGDGRPPAAQVWEGDELNLYRYAHASLIAANFTIDRVQPLWCRQLYTILRDALPPMSCSAIVYGNERGFSADVLVTDAARILGIPTVAELLNLYVHSDVLPTVMVAPSTFAVEHASIQEALRASYAVPTTGSLATLRHPLAAVVAPAVDVARFDPSIYRTRRFVTDSYVEEGVYSHPACRLRGAVPRDAQGRPVKPCVIVGFVARLAPEKNIGLFLQAAQRILQLHPFTRFTIMGDGVLRASLEELAERLQISWAVHFTGWVAGSDLPAVLAGIDIVVNPSLRAWSETFCIANVEAMAMHVPLVTFAVGGIGEYVSEPTAAANAGGDTHGEHTGEFSVAENAVVVHEATPTAVANAVCHLIRHPEVRTAIGTAARRTVEQHFATARQMSHYAKLYTALHELSN